MRAADIVAVMGFMAVVFGGMMLSTLRQAMRNRPTERIRARLRMLEMRRVAAATGVDPEQSELFRRQSPEGALHEWLHARLRRLQTVSGKGGVKQLAVFAAFAVIAALALARFSPLPNWAAPLLIIALPPLTVSWAYRRLIARFRIRFLNAFPDTLDLIIRAVRAGVPVAQAIGAAGSEAEEPVRAEFKTMGDAMKLGIDLKEALDAAVARIEIADFSFFAVCLLLQRETGGQLGETLDNLATIIRTRRDIRLKTKALTAEGRLTSRIIAAVPFVITGILYIVNRSYIEILFTHPTGHKMLMAAGVLLTIGIAVVQKMAKLETSR